MEALLKNGAVGTLIRYFINGNLSYSRKAGGIKALAAGYASSEDIVVPVDAEKDNPNMVTWELGML
jgi:hypothetical protein